MNKTLAALLVGLFTVTACHKDKPHTDPNSLCRATPITMERNNTPSYTSHGLGITDNMLFNTGENQDEDGAHEVVTLCKGATCYTAETNSVTPDGVTVQFVPGGVTVMLAATQAYDKVTVKINLACH